MKSTLSFASAIVAASAAAIDERALVCFGNRFLDTFDDLNAAPVAPEVSPVGTYHGLSYNGWVVADPTPLNEVVDAVPLLEALGLGFLGDITLSSSTPQSGDHVAATSIQDNLIQVGNVTLKPMGTIAADTTQNVVSFDPDYFYFGCALNLGNSAVAPSTTCTISVTGFFYATGTQTQTLRFTSTPGRLFGASMTRVNLPQTWLGLKNMTIGVEESDVTPGLTVGIIDSFSHCNHGPLIV